MTLPLLDKGGATGGRDVEEGGDPGGTVYDGASVAGGGTVEGGDTIVVGSNDVVGGSRAILKE